MYRFLKIASLSIALLLPAGDVSAGTLTFSDVCENYTLTRRASDRALVIRCPGQIDPWIVIPNCLRPTAAVRKLPTRTAEGGTANISVLTLTCN